MAFTKTFVAGWGDMDFNSHMKNTAYLDRSADVRMMYFAEHGFPMAEFMRLRIGPVIRRDEIEYFREVHLLEEIEADLLMAGTAADGSRFLLRNRFTNRDRKPVATVTSMIGWLDLSARKLVAPPPELLAILRDMSRAEDFQELPSSVR